MLTLIGTGRLPTHKW